jgi:hypothetical protein
MDPKQETPETGSKETKMTKTETEARETLAARATDATRRMALRTLIHLKDWPEIEGHFDWGNIIIYNDLDAEVRRARKAAALARKAAKEAQALEDLERLAVFQAATAPLPGL